MLKSLTFPGFPYFPHRSQPWTRTTSTPTDLSPTWAFYWRSWSVLLLSDSVHTSSRSNFCPVVSPRTELVTLPRQPSSPCTTRLYVVDSGDVCALVLLDLSAAFETVDHQTLLHVLSHCFGVKDAAFDCCKSYLLERMLRVCVNAQQSEPQSVDCSVPQGSVLGQMQFTAYTEDLADLINNHHLGYHLYADDTQLIASTPVVLAQVVVDHLKQCVTDSQRWCASRRLQLNPAKTELIWLDHAQTWRPWRHRMSHYVWIRVQSNT